MGNMWEGLSPKVEVSAAEEAFPTSDHSGCSLAAGGLPAGTEAPSRDTASIMLSLHLSA